MSIGMLILPIMEAIGKYLATEEAMSPFHREGRAEAADQALVLRQSY